MTTNQELINEMTEAISEIRVMKIAIDNKVNAFNTYYGNTLTKKIAAEDSRRKQEILDEKEKAKEERAKSRASKLETKAKCKRNKK